MDGMMHGCVINYITLITLQTLIGDIWFWSEMSFSDENLPRRCDLFGWVLPYLGPDLVAALAGLEVNNFSHAGSLSLSALSGLAGHHGLTEVNLNADGKDNV